MKSLPTLKQFIANDVLFSMRCSGRTSTAKRCYWRYKSLEKSITSWGIKKCTNQGWVKGPHSCPEGADDGRTWVWNDSDSSSSLLSSMTQHPRNGYLSGENARQGGRFYREVDYKPSWEWSWKGEVRGRRNTAQRGWRPRECKESISAG